MARIVFHSMAHRGDVFPYVPIASELSRRGHDAENVKGFGTSGIFSWF